MTQKIYLLTAGRYSDRHVEGVFSTAELAESARAGNPEARVECFDLDALVGQAYGPTWEVEIERKSGEIDDCDHEPRTRLRHRTAATVVENEPWGDPVDDYVIRVWSPISAEHAAKVAVEKRQEWLRAKGDATSPGGDR